MGLWQGFFGKRAQIYILFWLRIAVKWFVHGEQIFCWRQMSLNMYWQCVSVSGTASAQPSYNHFVASTKAPKHVLTKGLKLNLQKSLIPIYESKFTRQIFYDKWNWHTSLISKDICNKKIDKIVSSARANKLCHRQFAGMHGALGSTTSQAGISIYKIIGNNSTINPLVVCARLYINEFASLMF